MEISREDLAKRYASFSDDELLAIDREELTPMAQQCFDREVERRHFDEEIETDEVERVIGAPHEVPPDWLDTAVTACSFQASSGRRYGQEAQEACSILRDAGIPSQVVSEREDDTAPELLNVMVPGALSLKATSILDRDLFNAELEETWRTHFDDLSDEELFALHADDLCAGLLDRAARLKRVLEEAVDRRKSD